MTANFPLNATTLRLRSLFPTIAFAVMATIWFSAPAYADAFNVQDYGAKGDGSTDDSKAIAAAIQAATSHGAGNIVYFPGGAYVIGNQVPALKANSVILEGESQSNVSLRFSASTAHIAIGGVGTTVEDLTIANTGSAEVAGIVGDLAQNYVIDHCGFSGWKRDAVKLVKSSGTIRNNTFSINPNSTGIVIDDPNPTTILNNKFTATQSAQGHGVYVDVKSATNNVRIDSNNAFQSLQYGIQAYNNNDSGHLGTVEASSNTFQNCAYGFDGRRLSSLNLASNKFTNTTVITIRDSLSDKTTIFQNTLDSNQTGILAELERTSLLISENKLTNVSNTGIWVIDVPNMSVDNNSLSGLQNSTWGINPEGCHTRTLSDKGSVANNTITGFSSAIFSVNCRGLVLAFNTISQARNLAIVSQEDYFVTIQSNNLSNCNVSRGAGASVISVLPRVDGQFYGIFNNSYTGNVNNLAYFINVRSRFLKNVHVSGNTTTTMLPSIP